MKEEINFLSHYKLIQKSLTVSFKDKRNYYTIFLMVLESKIVLHTIRMLRSVVRYLS